MSTCPVKAAFEFDFGNGVAESQVAECTEHWHHLGDHKFKLDSIVDEFSANLKVSYT